TPQIQPEERDQIFNTPSSCRDIEKLLLQFDWSSENPERNTRLILRKYGKSLEQRNAAQSFLERALALRKVHEAATRPPGSSQVTFDPNKAFSGTPDLITAKSSAAVNTWKLNNNPATENRQYKRKRPLTEDQVFCNRYPSGK
ncbi:uncharacterized protein FOBCDRAFT_139402, partial [Fusarium oxysporum Fo47]|uniref:uncharacterized protein n=1 Tax=Fusarium oxysporum Fo47 TaxID=660027 RepID=UPI002869A194